MFCMIKMMMNTRKTINVLYFNTLSGSCRKRISRDLGVKHKQQVEMLSRSSSSGVRRGSRCFVVNNLFKLINEIL